MGGSNLVVNLIKFKGFMALQRILPGLALIVMGFSSLSLSEHSRVTTKRPKASSRASECGKSKFESTFGLNRLEDQASSSPKASRPLIPIQAQTEKRYGGGGLGATWSYDVTSAWRYKAPDDRVFRLAVSEALSCLLDHQEEAAGFLGTLLNQDSLFSQVQPNAGKLKTDQNALPRDLLVYRKMRSLFESLSGLLRELQGEKEASDFFQAFLKQVQKTEQSLLSENPKLEPHPDLIKQFEKLRKDPSGKLFSLVKSFSETQEFDYWLHPILANYFRKALKDPGFEMKPDSGMSSAQANDLGREFQQILQGTPTPSDVRGPAPSDPLATQGKVHWTGKDSSSEALLSTPQPAELLKPDLEQFAHRLRDPDERKRNATTQDVSQKLARSLNDRNEHFGGAMTPEHLALRDAAQAALTGLSKNATAAAAASDLAGKEAQDRNKTDREVLQPLRQKLEQELVGFTYPISIGAVGKVSQYPGSIKELIQMVTRRLEPKTLSREAQENLEDFLKTGETQHFFDLLFKNRSAFEGAIGFLNSAREAAPGDQALLRANSLFSGISANSLKATKKWEEDYVYTRSLLKKSIAKLSQDPRREKDRDAHLLALRLLDEIGLVGVTDRDTKNNNAYLPETLYQELKSEQAALRAACESDANQENCIRKLELSILERARHFVGGPTGLTSEIRRRLLETFSPANPNRETIEAQLQRNDHLPKGSPLRQAALFSGPAKREEISGFQSTEIPMNEQLQRLDGKGDRNEEPGEVVERIPEMYRHQRELSKGSAQLAVHLAAEIANAAAMVLEEDPDKKAQLELFYQCLSERLVEQASHYNNSLAIRTLAQWYSNPDAPGQSGRLKMAAAQLQCDLPERVEEVFSPPTANDPQARALIRAQAGQLESLHQKEAALMPSTLTEQALMELEHLRRLETDIKREGRLFPDRENPVLSDLRSKRDALLKKLSELGLSSVLSKPGMTELLAPPSDSDLLSKADLETLEKEYKLLYDSQTNSFLITPETKIDNRLLGILSRAHGIHLRYLGPGREKELFFLNGGNSQSLLALMSHEGAMLGISPLATKMSWEEIKRLDVANPDLKPLPQWFPLTEATSVRLLERNGKIEADFIATEKLSEEVRKKMEALIQARTDSHTAASEYGKLGHAAKAYFGSMAGYDPSQSSESKKLQEAYNEYANLRAAFGAIGIVPVGNTPLTTDEFNRNELKMMRDYLNREEEAIHDFLTNVDTLHELSQMAVTAALPVGPLLSLEAKLAKLAAGTGKLAFSARQALRTTRLAIQLRNTTRSGLGTAAKFEGVSLMADGLLSFLPDSTNAIFEDRISRAKSGDLAEGWRKYPTHPAHDPKWGAFDKKTGQPVDPQQRKEFLQAMLEFNIEESMDLDGNGIIDELQGPGGTPVPFAKRRSFGSSLTDPHRLQGFVDSASFFRNLGLAKSLPVPRWITLPTEMAFAGAIQEASRSQESLRWEAKQTGHEPGSLAYRTGQAALHSFVEGGRFGFSGTASNAALARMAGGKSSTFNVIFGALLFSGVDTATKAALNQAQYGQTGFERGSWEEFGKNLLRENAVTFYIGLDMARSGLSRQQHRDLKTAYLEGGETALRKALSEKAKPKPEEVESAFQSVLNSVSPQEFAEAPRSVQAAHLRFLDSRLKEGNERLDAAQRAALRAGEEVITPQEARRVGEINRELLRRFGDGGWNRGQEISTLLQEQDSILKRVSESLEKAQERFRFLQAEAAEQAASSDPKVQSAFEQQARALEAHQELVSNLTEATARMAPLRILAEPVETIAALSDPRSELAQRHFEDRPQALSALKRYQKSLGEKAWESLSKFGARLSEDHILPNLKRSDSGEGGATEMVFGNRPTGAGITGREQRAAAEFVERVFKDKKTSLQEKRELLGILLQLDPVKADSLARSQNWSSKTK